MIETTTEKRAREYNKYRLPYSNEAAAFIIGKIGCKNGVIADIGTGTGLVARCFTGRAKKIYALDPDREMRRVAQSELSVFREINVLPGSAEETGLPDGSVDLITVGNALHRFDGERSKGEFARILKRDGWLAVLSYRFNEASLGQAMNDVRNQFPQLRERKKGQVNDKPSDFFFGSSAPGKYLFPQIFEENWDTFWGAAKSCMEAPDEDDYWFNDYQTAYRKIFDTYAKNDVLTVYYNTEVVLGRVI